MEETLKDKEYFDRLSYFTGNALEMLEKAGFFIRVAQGEIASVVDESNNEYGLEARTVIGSMLDSIEYLKELLEEEKQLIVDDAN